MLTRIVLISWPCDPPASASQSAEMIGLSHRTRPTLSLLQIEGSWQPSTKHVYRCHFSSSMTSMFLCHILAILATFQTFSLLCISTMMICDLKKNLFLRQGLILLTRVNYNGTISAHYNLCLPGSSDPPISASWVAGTTGMDHHTELIFLIWQGFTVLPRLVLNSKAQVTHLPRPTKALRL